MVRPDWNIFEAKFSENPTKNFEWFCYLLFCEEFNQPYGVPRLYNQPGIETELISVGEDKIGWQAKYFTNRINYDDIKDSIEKTLRIYPEITKLILYTNKDFGDITAGRYSKKLKEGVELCNSKKVVFDPRCASYFDKIVSDVKYQQITSFFFSNEHETRQAIQKQISRQGTQTISNHTEKYEKQIDEQYKTEKIRSTHSLNPLIDLLKEKIATTKFEDLTDFYLKGVAGIGKSEELKKTYNHFITVFSKPEAFQNYQYVFIPFFYDLKEYQKDFFNFEDKEGFYLLFLDSLDELSDEKILELSKTLKNIKSNYKYAKFIVSGRNASFLSTFFKDENVPELFLNTYVDEKLGFLLRQYQGTFFESLVTIPFYREFIETEKAKQITSYKQFFNSFVDEQLKSDKQNHDYVENISPRTPEMSLINLGEIKTGLIKLVADMNRNGTKRFSESDLKHYLQCDNLSFALNSSLFDYKSKEEIYFVSNIFFEYFYALSLEKKPFRQIKKEFINSNGSIRVSKVNILYILINNLTPNDWLYRRLERLLSRFSPAYILLADFIALPSDVRFEKYEQIIDEFNKKKELIYYGRFYEKYDLFANIPSLADKMFELLPDEKQLKALTMHIRTIKDFLNCPTENSLNSFCNAVILLGFGEEKRWNEECQNVLKQIALPLLQFFLHNELARHVKGLLSSLVVFLWYKTYGWTEDWIENDWKQFIFDMGIHTSEAFCEFLDDNDYKIKRTLFIRFNENPSIWQLFVPLTIKSCVFSKNMPGLSSPSPVLVDDDFKTPVIHLDDDMFYFKYAVQSKENQIKIQDILKIIEGVTKISTHIFSTDFESRDLIKELYKQYCAKVSNITHDDVPVICSIIKNVAKNMGGLYTDELIRYIEPLLDEIKVDVLKTILEGIKHGELDYNYSLRFPIIYLLFLKENTENAIKYLKEIKKISKTCYKEVFFFCLRKDNNHPCYAYCDENYKPEFPEEYAKEEAYNKRREEYKLKIEEMRKKEVEFILYPNLILTEVDKIFEYLDSDEKPFNEDTERMNLYYLKPQYNLALYDSHLKDGVEDPKIFSEFVLNILYDASFNEEKKVDRDMIKEDILLWGDLSKNFWRFFFRYYVRKHQIEEVKVFLNEHPEVKEKIKETMLLELPNILDSQDVSLFDGGGNRYQIVPFVYYLENIFEKDILDNVNLQNMKKFVAFPAWCLTEYGFHAIGDYEWGSFETVYDWIETITGTNKKTLIDYSIEIYPSLNSDISKTQIISCLCNFLIQGTLESDKVVSLIVQESTREFSIEYKSDDNLSGLNCTLQHFWDRYELDISNLIESIVNFSLYKRDEKNYCRKSMCEYVIRHADSEKKKKIISTIKERKSIHNLSKEIIYLLAKLGDEETTIKLIDEYISEEKLDLRLYWSGHIFGITNASKKAFKKMIKLFEYTIQKDSDRRQYLHSLAVAMINQNVSTKNFKILKKYLEKIINYRRNHNQYFEYVQNFLNGVEQRVYQ